MKKARAAKASKKAPKKSRRPHVMNIGRREIETLGLSNSFWTDLYHRSMTASWPAFFAIAAVIFIVLNAGFAFLYWFGNEPIANLPVNTGLGLFYFSIETLATVGYGDMHPQTDYGHFIATVEIFTGMSFLAVMTGLIFARFSRPRARVLFAQNPVVGQHDGQQTLMIRMANARHNTISKATARLWLIRVESTAEGQQLRRYYELKLQRDEHPVFALTWTVFHTIDETSPLYGLTADDLARTDTALVLNVGGVDDNSAQQLYARQLYSQQDIRWRHRYSDIASTSAEGRIVINYGKFHEILPDEDYVASSAAPHQPVSHRGPS